MPNKEIGGTWPFAWILLTNEYYVNAIEHAPILLVCTFKL